MQFKDYGMQLPQYMPYDSEHHCTQSMHGSYDFSVPYTYNLMTAMSYFPPYEVCYVQFL